MMTVLTHGGVAFAVGVSALLIALAGIIGKTRPLVIGASAPALAVLTCVTFQSQIETAFITYVVFLILVTIGIPSLVWCIKRAPAGGSFAP